MRGLTRWTCAGSARANSVDVEIDAMDQAALTGTIERIIPSGDADHTFLVEILLPARAGLFPGMFGKARFRQ
jgi:hypothetical protein